ncbi:hypothetical protein JD844_002725 [Phrynosoma platyrhinos]|uniref:Uncharacterized protein n=1 Tax=Phrynosoma platyrhinos TaxID=52577 RepID=A0ABQ7TCP2_PHRPL|nr:hypothetical protein JD844_002725 [Phrynosoma platyrhinos]
MQKFIEADYYELDWYYEECTDGNRNMKYQDDLAMSRNKSINEEESFESDCNNECRHRCCEDLDILEEE